MVSFAYDSVDGLVELHCNYFEDEEEASKRQGSGKDGCSKNDRVCLPKLNGVCSASLADMNLIHSNLGSSS